MFAFWVWIHSWIEEVTLHSEIPTFIFQEVKIQNNFNQFWQKPAMSFPVNTREIDNPSQHLRIHNGFPWQYSSASSSPKFLILILFTSVIPKSMCGIPTQYDTAGITIILNSLNTFLFGLKPWTKGWGAYLSSKHPSDPTSYKVLLVDMSPVPHPELSSPGTGLLLPT